jgi:hypothetical protein
MQLNSSRINKSLDQTFYRDPHISATLRTSPFYELNCCSESKDVHVSPPLEPILRHLNTVHSLPLHDLNACFNIFPQSMLRSLTSSCLFRVFRLKVYAFHLETINATCLAQPIFLNLINPIIFYQD